MDEIKGLDNKYIILKLSDVNQLNNEERELLQGIQAHIEYNRKLSNKMPFRDNHYVVLNLDDEIDLNKLYDLLHTRKLQAQRKEQEAKKKFGGLYELYELDDYEAIAKVKDIAVDLVNAILKAKGG